MKKIILSLHTSLDGFVAGPNGEMDWIKLDQELFDLVGTFTNEADTALYGRVTYDMMDAYWPTAGDEPNASRHDIEHSKWYKESEKVVVSKTMRGTVKDKTTVISDNVATEVEKLKHKGGTNIMIFGSPTIAHALMEHNLIDEYWLFINPIILGQGIPLFAKIKDRIALKPGQTKTFQCGVTALHYTVVR